MEYTHNWFLSLDLDTKVMVWNAFCHDNKWENAVYTNDMYGYELVFGATREGLQDLARAIQFSEFNYIDNWFMVLGDGNIKTFSYDETLLELIDLDELIEWANTPDNEIGGM